MKTKTPMESYKFRFLESINHSDTNAEPLQNFDKYRLFSKVRASINLIRGSIYEALPHDDLYRTMLVVV